MGPLRTCPKFKRRKEGSLDGGSTAGLGSLDRDAEYLPLSYLSFSVLDLCWAVLAVVAAEMLVVMVAVEAATLAGPGLRERERQDTKML